ncbi:acyl carrier protein [Streptomyces bambusae]|uniref:acyl carrier protein n=1 Tax=Streptomyces bambusae TaxID=1550616 RepID=UPI001CFE3454|nr:acyl carrier protein [Streptomyces bambusae]MCB5165684.1 acyl carrier protein [Streptomyces bambusae]
MTRDRSAVIAVTGTSAPSPDAPADEAAEVREFVTQAWCRLLGATHLTEHSDFFVRGGDSLLMTRLVRWISREFGVSVPVHEMSRRNLGDQVALVHAMVSTARPQRARPAAGVREVRTFLTQSWRDLLGCPTPGERSDFFALGGDSLLMTRLVQRIGREFGVPVPVHDLLAAPALGDQVRLVVRLLTSGPCPTLDAPERAA